ncbi:hypothetical protein GAYE_SCF37G5119 [Galdieria yellowstonensis]|uniref:Uncharacterized protein n=1 Tax=Galdieria yellowstonensis TaxID=3028027 RepID=A0AAV9IIE1_9RHOD|nr:hypothetical protein GAYE_SCF37G5119 [Galdieria yellowstonensis]
MQTTRRFLTCVGRTLLCLTRNDAQANVKLNLRRNICSGETWRTAGVFGDEKLEYPLVNREQAVYEVFANFGEASFSVEEGSVVVRPTASFLPQFYGSGKSIFDGMPGVPLGRSVGGLIPDKGGRFGAELVKKICEKALLQFEDSSELLA